MNPISKWMAKREQKKLSAEKEAYEAAEHISKEQGVPYGTFRCGKCNTVYGLDLLKTAGVRNMNQKFEVLYVCQHCVNK